MSGRFAYDATDLYSNALQWLDAQKRGALLCVVKKVSRSGMSRTFQYIAYQKGSKYPGGYRQFDVFLYTLMGYQLDNRDGIKRGGCGMDMNFDTVYSVAHKLYSLKLINKTQLATYSQNTPSCF